MLWPCFTWCSDWQFPYCSWPEPAAIWGFAMLFGFAMGADYMLIPLVTADCFGWLVGLGKDPVFDHDGIFTRPMVSTLDGEESSMPATAI